MTLLFVFTASVIIAGFAGFAMDINTYRGSAESSDGIADIVWSVNRGNLGFKKTADNWRDSLLFVIQIEDNGEAIQTDTIWRIVEMPLGEMVSSSFLLFDKYPVTLPSNRSYTARLIFLDIGAADSSTISNSFWIPDFSGDFKLSELVLLSELSQDESDGPFTQGGMKMLPNPARIYGGNFHTLYYYFEIYRGEKHSDMVTFWWELRSSDDRLLQRAVPGQIETKTRDFYIANGLDVSILPPGKYFIDLTVQDTVIGKELSARNGFIMPEPVPLTASETGNIEQEYNYYYYFLSTSDRDLYENLTDDGKREFTTRFWEKNDPTPDTPENEFRAKIIERWHTANIVFNESAGLEPNGWNTDKGRIYIKFGKPDNIERNPISMGINPYEIWDYYALSGSSTFVFADIRGINEWRLVHSDYPGEIYEPNWKEKLMDPHNAIPAAGN